MTNGTLDTRPHIAAALLGPFGFGNLGDAAIQQAVIANIRKRLPEAILYGVSLNPHDTEQRHGIRSFPIRLASAEPRSRMQARSLPRMVRAARTVLFEALFIARSYRTMRACTHLIISGGGQLDDDWGGAREHPYALLKWSLLAKLSGAKLIYLSVGAGPLNSEWSKRFVRLALRLADYRSYRDKESRKFVADLGLKEPGVVYPDPAFGVESHTTSSQRQRHPMTIAIGPIPFFDPRVWPEKNQDTYDTYVSKLVEFSAWVAQRGFRVRFVPGSLTQDRAVIADVMGRLRGAPYSVCEDHASEANVGDVDSLLDELRSSAIVISSRFHGALLAAVVHRPIIALTHHPKIDALMRNMGQQTLCADINTFTVDSLKTMFLASIATRDQIASTLREYVASRTRLLDEQYDRVFCEHASAGA